MQCFRKIFYQLIVIDTKRKETTLIAIQKKYHELIYLVMIVSAQNAFSCICNYNRYIESNLTHR